MAFVVLLLSLEDGFGMAFVVPLLSLEDGFGMAFMCLFFLSRMDSAWLS